MSKESDLRAMREARYNRRATATPRRVTHPFVDPIAPRVPVAPRAAAPQAAASEAPAAQAATDTEELCGHRSMNGRTCTREHGHTAKNHRYS